MEYLRYVGSYKNPPEFTLHTRKLGFFHLRLSEYDGAWAPFYCGCLSTNYLFSLLILSSE